MLEPPPSSARPSQDQRTSGKLVSARRGVRLLLRARGRDEREKYERAHRGHRAWSSRAAAAPDSSSRVAAARSAAPRRRGGRGRGDDEIRRSCGGLPGAAPVAPLALGGPRNVRPPRRGCLRRASANESTGSLCAAAQRNPQSYLASSEARRFHFPSSCACDTPTGRDLRLPPYEAAPADASDRSSAGRCEAWHLACARGRPRAWLAATDDRSADDSARRRLSRWERPTSPRRTPTRRGGTVGRRGRRRRKRRCRRCASSGVGRAGARGGNQTARCLQDAFLRAQRSS